MSIAFNESDSLRFEFDENWRGLKWDEHAAYRDARWQRTESKAVDFSGVYNAELWLLEAKDFRGYRIQNKQRLSNGELIAEVAEKVRDSLSGLLWSCDRAGRNSEVTFLAKTLFDRTHKVRVVLWLETDAPLRPDQARHLTESVKRRLAWLSPRVLVQSLKLPKEHEIPGLTVENLALS